MTDDKMTDDALHALNRLQPAEPSPEARKLALNAAMAAFDAAQAQPKRKAGWTSRWRIGTGLGVPLGAALAALILIPAGTELYTATSHRMDAPPPSSARLPAGAPAKPGAGPTLQDHPVADVAATAPATTM
ncbi:MAG TPA: hypothetical protein VHZ56_13125, partial [Devosia sp.]|nr:hypothetical protein [Devosia sp.]